MPRSRTWRRSLLLGALVATPLGCGADAPTPATPAQQVLRSFAATCPAPAAGPSAEASGLPQVLVDAALFHAPPQAAAAGSAGDAAAIAETIDALDAADVEGVSTPHVLATDGVPAEISISDEHGVRLRVLARVQPSGEVHLALDAEHSSATTAPARLQASVVVPDGQVAMVRAPAGAGDDRPLAMLVRPSVIRQQADLARIMTCKRDAARRQAVSQ